MSRRLMQPCSPGLVSRGRAASADGGARRSPPHAPRGVKLHFISPVPSGNSLLVKPCLHFFTGVFPSLQPWGTHVKVFV